MSNREIADTRESWNRATLRHNAHKGDQAAFLRGGGDVLFPEELELLGELGGRTLVHVQCNSGQDSLCLARRGAKVHGVDFSGVAIDFARTLSRESGIAATFEEAEAIAWLDGTDRRFQIAFASYGVTPWHRDLDAWMRGVARVLEPGGMFAYMEFHPLVWSLGKDLALSGDDYFHKGPYVEPVGDYVGESGGALGGAATPAVELPPESDVAAYGYQHTIGELVTSLAGAGFTIEVFREYPYANGCRVSAGLVAGEGRRWVWPQGKARLPLMFGLRARKPR